MGAGAGAALAAAWAMLMWAPSAGLSLSGISFVVALLMCLIGVIAVIASIKGHSAVLMVAFLASFLPVGAYLIQVEVWLRWLGLLDLILLAAAAMIWWGQRGVQGDPL